jgi:hypothetical protein
MAKVPIKKTPGKGKGKPTPKGKGKGKKTHIHVTPKGKGKKTPIHVTPKGKGKQTPLRGGMDPVPLGKIKTSFTTIGDETANGEYANVTRNCLKKVETSSKDSRAKAMIYNQDDFEDQTGCNSSEILKWYKK